ncbi:MAG: HEAT repeat domain-containing protein [Blastocatellia bacterium]|nr:HEAT repeat domain-containing protein [Blastocatellia bacterium]
MFHLDTVEDKYTRKGLSLSIKLGFTSAFIALLLFCTSLASGSDQLNRLLQGDSSSPAMIAFNAARDLIDEGKWESAERKLKSLIKDYPKDRNVDAALFYLADVLGKQGKNNEAADELRRLIADYPNSPWTKDAKAKLIEITGRTSDQASVQDAINEQDESLKTYALQSLCQGNPESCAKMVANILKPEYKASARFKANAVALLGQHASRQGKAILMDIARNASDQKMRKNAIFWLGQTSGEEAFDLLKELATDSGDEEVAKAAVFALSQHGGERASQFLSEMARSATSPKVRKEAIFWLGQRGDEKALDELKSIFDSDQDAAVRKQALFAFSQHRSERARAFLLEVARSSSADVALRKEAIFWLGQRGDDQAAEELIAIYDADTNETIRKQVIFSLSQMVGRSARARTKLFEIARSDSDENSRANAIFWLGRQGGEESCQFLIQIYDQEKSEVVKKKVISSLGQLNKKCALTKLIDIAKNDASVELRRQAVFWIGQSKDPEAIKFLEDILK